MKNNNQNGFNSFLVGAVLGAAAVVILDKRLRTIFLDFLEVKKNNVQDNLQKARDKSVEIKEELTERALNTADEKLSQARDKVKKKKKRKVELENNSQ